jgi:hypothetical protein
MKVLEGIIAANYTKVDHRIIAAMTVVPERTYKRKKGTREAHCRGCSLAESRHHQGCDMVPMR